MLNNNNRHKNVRCDRYGKSERRLRINEIFEVLEGTIRRIDNIGLMEEGSRLLVLRSSDCQSKEIRKGYVEERK